MYEISIAIPCLIVFLMFLFSVSMWEKHPIDCYGPALTGKFPQGRSYLVAARSDADDFGLTDLSIHKHSRFDILVVFWFSPDRDYLVSAGQGKIAGQPTKQTWIYSRMHNGTVFVTTDGFDEGDPSGLYVTKRVVNVSLAKLIAAHRKRLDAEVGITVPYDEPAVAEAVRNIQRERAQRMIEKGRAHWIDDEQSVWRYTLSGACGVCLGWFGQLWSGITQFWRV